MVEFRKCIVNFRVLLTLYLLLMALNNKLVKERNGFTSLHNVYILVV